MPRGIQLRAQVEDEIQVRGVRQFRRGVIGLESREDVRRVIHEIQHIGRVLAGVRTVQARERLHGLDAREPLVHIHPAEQRLVKAGLKLIRHEEDLILIAFEGFADVASFQIRVQSRAVFRESIRPGFLVVHLAGESHQRTHRVAAILDVAVNRQLPAHRLQPARHHHHGLGLSREQRSHVLAEEWISRCRLMGLV